MFDTVMVVSTGHAYFDKRVYLKCVEPLSKIFRKVLYISTQKRIKSSFLVPDNVVDIFVGDMPIRTIERTLFWEKEFRRIIYSQNCPLDLVVVHDIPFGYLFPNLFLDKMKKKYRCKVIIDMHEYLPEILFPSLKENNLLTKLNDKVIVEPYALKADAYIAVCEYVKEYLRKKGVSEEKIYVSPNYAHASPQNFGAKNNAIGFVGRLIRQNGPRLIGELVKAAIDQFGYEFRFIGSKKESAIQLFSNKGLMDHEKVVFLGMLPYEEMLFEISKLRFTISHFELSAKNTIHSLPNKFFDSLVSKTPVIIPYQLVEQRRILERFNLGYSIDLLSENWIRDIGEIIRDQKEYDRKMQNLDKYYTKFLWNSHEEEYLRFIRDIMK